MEDFLYAYNQPKKFGKYDLILDGKIIADEVVTKSGSIGGGESNTGLTAEQIELLTTYASAEGRNIPISEDGEIITQVGHTYTITAKELPVKCTDADFNPLCEVAAHKQIAFVATGTAAYVDNVTCTVTEVFKPAAPVKLSGNGGGEPEGDYVTLDANGCITSGRLDTLVDGSYLQFEKLLATWNIALPKLSSAYQMFSDSHFDKESTIFILNSIPAFSDNLEHTLTLGVNGSLYYDPEVHAAIIEAKNKGWDIFVKWKLMDNDGIKLPQGYTILEYLEGSGIQYIDTLFIPDSNSGLHTKHLCLNNSNIRPAGQIEASLRMYAISINASQGLAYGFGQTYHPATHKDMYDKLQTGSVNFLNRGVEQTYLEIDGLILHGVHSDGVSFSCNNSIYIFGLNSNNTLSNNFTGRIYRVSITQYDEFVHDFIPALDDTGAPCMYDIVSNTPFYNDGVGDFIYPTEETTATYSLRRVLPDWGKLTAHGLKRLYHVPDGYTGELIDYAIENGYKRIVESEKPEDGYWIPQWRETDDEIILDWIESEPPTIDEISE